MKAIKGQQKGEKYFSEKKALYSGSTKRGKRGFRGRRGILLPG